MTEQLIDIDLRPDAAIECYARVEADALPPEVERDASGKPERMRLGAGRPRLVIESPARWLAALSRLVGQRVRLQLWREKKRRTLAQNKLLWGTVYPVVLAGLREIALDAGEQCPFRDVDALHEALKYRHLSASIVRVAGEEWEIPPSTTRLTTEQFSAYVEAICRWAAAKGIYVPPPGERIEV